VSQPVTPSPESSSPADAPACQWLSLTEVRESELSSKESTSKELNSSSRTQVSGAPYLNPSSAARGCE